MSQFSQEIQSYLEFAYHKTISDATLSQLYEAIGAAVQKQIASKWSENPPQKRACYLSAEFLTGRLVHSNLMNLGLLEECRELLRQHGRSIRELEEIRDSGLGNGGLGRLAACFLDSAATRRIPLDGFGIRYRYGIFKQRIENGFQREYADDWQRFGDPWSIRREDEAVLVRLGSQTVRAVPYDMPVIGWQGASVNTLRLWQAEAVEPFDLERYNKHQYSKAVREKTEAEAITAVLYPNDDTDKGKKLRLKQQYFFTSATIQTLLKRLEEEKIDLHQMGEHYALQLNDTHPVVAIPELLRLLMEEHGFPLEEALPVIRSVYSYTNHTVMSEALEKWDEILFAKTLPQVYPYVKMLDLALRRELNSGGITGKEQEPYRILQDGKVHMARMALFCTHAVNGVAEIHSELLKTTVMPEWYRLYPEHFSNKTNGITPRRWLALCNPELSGLITGLIGDGWITDLEQLERLLPYADDKEVLERFQQVKVQKKQQLSDDILRHENHRIDPQCCFDLQIKRIHEYKRQMLNALSLLDLYFSLRDGELQDFAPTAFLIGGLAAPGYTRAKGIIKLISEVARLIQADPAVSGQMQVLFVQGYNVSYAERLIPAADISQQISTAGTEASGTGNMKLMLNGAVTLGTLDGANVEIVREAGLENNYIFGATVEELKEIEAEYNPRALYHSTPRIRRAMDALVDGTLDDGGTGLFRELYNAILKGTGWHTPDHYYLLHDFLPYQETRIRANRDYQDTAAFARKCWLNLAHAGKFSSDRTVQQYASEIWDVQPAK